MGGSFSGGDGGRISGRISGSCKTNVEGEKAPGSGSFSGTVYLTKGYASGRWGGKSAGVSQSGGWTIRFTPLEYEEENAEEKEE